MPGEIGIWLLLTKGKAALVSREDFERVAAFRWCVSLDGRGGTYYALRWARKEERTRWKAQKVRLAHFVMGMPPSELPPGHIIEHKNQDSLDNRRCNLWIIHEKLNMGFSPNWKTKAAYGECAECSRPVPATDFLCFSCYKSGTYPPAF